MILLVPASPQGFRSLADSRAPSRTSMVPLVENKSLDIIKYPWFRILPPVSDDTLVPVAFTNIQDECKWHWRHDRADTYGSCVSHHIRKYGCVTPDNQLRDDTVGFHFHHKLKAHGFGEFHTEPLRIVYHGTAHIRKYDWFYESTLHVVCVWLRPFSSGSEKPSDNG